MESVVRQVEQYPLSTRILSIDSSKIGQFVFSSPRKSFLEDWDIKFSKTSPDAAHLLEAASQLRTSDIPVAFPTETVYGLGADATRTSAVLGIYEAKRRPSDNPLIVHISSLAQLRKLLLPPQPNALVLEDPSTDPIPSIYHPLIQRFWPGALTILLPLPTPSPLAPQVNASLPTFGARMPSSLLALALIHTAQIPLAAPSANTSTKPSPTTAAHVLQDLSGRIEMILDGGPCNIGVESTVVDGLSQPPMVLRPGGVSIDSLRACPGWEGVVTGYADGTEEEKPRAPGMKYRHYSPKAKVILIEGALKMEFVTRFLKEGASMGVLSTRKWRDSDFGQLAQLDASMTNVNDIVPKIQEDVNSDVSNHARDDTSPSSTKPAASSIPAATHSQIQLNQSPNAPLTDIWTIGLGPLMADIARGLFSALRELDARDVDVIFAEGIPDCDTGPAAAVMNRLRKAAEWELKS